MNTGLPLQHYGGLKNKTIDNKNWCDKSGKGNYGKLKRPKNDDGKASYNPKLPSDVLRIKTERGFHSTQKPVAIYEFLLKYYSKPEWTCLDVTCGSGSCGVAC